MISALQSFKDSNHIYENHNNTRRHTTVKATRVMGFRKKRLLSGCIDQGGLPQGGELSCPPLGNWSRLIYGVSQFLEAEI